MKPIEFDPPITVNGQKWASVTMRPSTMGDEEDAQVMALENASAAPLTQEMFLFSVLTGIPYDDMRAIPPYQYRILRAAYDELNKPRPTIPGDYRNGAEETVEKFPKQRKEPSQKAASQKATDRRPGID